MTEKVVELIKWTAYRLWKLNQPGPPPGWDPVEERKKYRKKRLRVVKKKDDQ